MKTYQFAVRVSATVHPEVEADSHEEAKELAKQEAVRICDGWLDAEIVEQFQGPLEDEEIDFED